LPVERPPQRGDVIVRVYTAWMGVSNRSTPSRKKGRFSGKKRAKRLLTAIWATSASTWEKSGLIVASRAVLADGFHFTSRPARLSVRPWPSGWPGASACATSCALA